MLHRTRLKNLLLNTVHKKRLFYFMNQSQQPLISIVTSCRGCLQNATHHYQLLQLNSKKIFQGINLSCFRLYCTSSSKGNDEVKVSQDDSSSTEKNKKAANTDVRETIVKVIPTVKKRRTLDLTSSYTANIYITPVRAMQEYLLSPQDLEACQRIIRRSPYDTEQKIMVYLRQDVEQRAVDVWGSLENITKERNKHKSAQERYYNNRMEIFQLPKSTHDTRVQPPFSFESKKFPLKQQENIFKSGSGRVVLYAIVINGLNFAMKSIAWMYTGSHSMFAEAIHSLADTCNQIILAFGISASIKRPDSIHPYGYMNIRYVSSLISGVGIFCFGTGLSWYHGIQGLLYPQQLESLYWALATLGGAFLSESATLAVAVNEIRESAKAAKMTFWEYVRLGYDPSVNVVLLEDLAAVAGVGIAATCMGISHYTGSPFADSLGSMLIGCVLGGVASFIIHTNTTALVGRSIPSSRQQQIRNELESDRMVRALHDIKATDMGGKHVRFKAEVDFDGREITRSYLYNQDLEVMLNEIQSFNTTEEVENFMLKHGENVIDMLGAEVDRIERNLKQKHPELRHVDLEVL